ncbi:RNA-binding protein [Halalkalibacillus sediminis]|uniref:RNA-binding protein n=1 Tax=Halalkalibacillus sediminis TaxID=2018042 RepID=A0A2I0QW33_9BACI|nr:YlmH/Sll1252 family protein [Halalkalibacillus sediminis]PKR78551.1 RNA-binding protein [Halalkalibacillus sediminis]
MDIYQHFRKEEQPVIDQFLDWKEQVERQFIPVLSDFMDPREQHILRSLIGNNDDLNLSFHGGMNGAERQRAYLYPFYEEVTDEDFAITILQGTYHTKFVTLTHRDLLGTLMSLGIQRKKLGDILVNDGTFQIITDEDIALFLKMNFTKVKKSSIVLTEVSKDQMITMDDRWVEKEGTVSSARLDVIMKHIYQLSRQDAQQLIAKEAVKVNHRVVSDPTFTIQPSDLISVRKLGRSKMIEILGETKKNKLRIKTAKLK